MKTVILDHSYWQNFGWEEWKDLRDLVDDKSIVIKGADKGSCVVIWDREDYLKEADTQLIDNKIYRDVKYTKNMLSSIVDKNNKIFQGLSKTKHISEKELEQFTSNNKNATELGKLYLLPKIHKRLFHVPGRLAISSCGTPTEKVSGHLDFCLKKNPLPVFSL